MDPLIFTVLFSSPKAAQEAIATYPEENRKDFEPKQPESRYTGGNDSRHGYASSTPLIDGDRLYVFFGKSGVYCLTLDGQQIWHADVGDKATGWGSSNSPVPFGNLVIINAAVESRSLVALDKHTGEVKCPYCGSIYALEEAPKW